MKQCEVCGLLDKSVYGKKGIHKMDLCGRHRYHMDKHGKILERTRFTPNEFVKHDNYIEIVMYNHECLEVGRTLIDIDLSQMVNGYKWCLDDYGYATSKSNGGKLIFLHRLITNAPKGMDVDHRNHNTLDNRLSNLRVCTHRENLCNQTISTRNTSGYKGVYWNKQRNKWQVQITVDGKVKYLGRFDSMTDAMEVYRAAEVKYHGEFAYTG